GLGIEGDAQDAVEFHLTNRAREATDLLDGLRCCVIEPDDRGPIEVVGVEVVLQARMNALDRGSRAVEELSLVDLLLLFDARHAVNPEACVHQPEVLKERTSEPNVV